MPVEMCGEAHKEIKKKIKPAAEISPAAPAPMATKLYFVCGLGGTHLSGCTLSSNVLLYSSKGVTPNF